VRRILLSLGMVAGGILLSAIMFVTLRAFETRNAEAAFKGVAEQRLDTLETNIKLTINNLVSLGALCDASQDIKRDEFDRFTSSLLARNQAIQALEWIPKVPRRLRRKYEQAAREAGFPAFEFKDRASPGKLSRAGDREEYFPVFFVAPWRGNEKALGFDLASDPARRTALQSAADSGQLVASDRIKLVQETSDQYGFLVFRPVYSGGTKPESPEARDQELTGFALAVFRVADMVEKVGAAPTATSGVDLAIFDLNAHRGERLLYPKSARFDSIEELASGFKVTRTISVTGRSWELAAFPLPGSFTPVRWSSWATLIAGMLLTCLVMSHLAERHRAEESLQHSEERARLLFATIPHAAFVFDIATHEFLEINDATVLQYGYSRDELLRMKATQIRSSEEVERFTSYLGQAQLADGAAGQWKHLSRDGRVIDVEVHLQRVDYDGHKACLAIAQDVTKRNRLELDLRHAQKLEAVGRLAAGIAHEINTPIQFIGDNVRFLGDAFSDLNKVMQKYQRLSDAAANGVASLMLADEVAEAEMAVDINYLVEEIPKAISQSLDGVTRVATLVRAMKVFAHPDGKEKAASNINEALVSTLTVARNELKYVADVETEFNELPLIVCNIGEVNQVFLNLLVNAAHAISDVKQEGDKKGVIRVRTSVEERYVLISIADTGCGIPDNVRDKVFDPFFTTKESGKGTGQGLAIARSVVVEGHGGTLTFESEIGKGTTFYIRLPLEVPTAVKEKSTTLAASASGSL
jgi:PAS domain S-box-containing protein